MIVGQVRDHFAHRDQRHPQEQADQTDDDNPPDLILHLAPGGSNVGLTHCKLSDMGDTGQGHQCQHGADSGQHRRNNQSPTYGPEYLGYRASRGGFIFNTHELS